MQKLSKVHEIMADFLDSARRVYEGRDRPTATRIERENAVTRWRWTAHVINQYANGPEGSTWQAYWMDAMDRAAYLDLVNRRSRFQRDGDGERDSIEAWEYGLAVLLVTGQSHADAAVGYGKEEPVRRLGLELEITLGVAAAYTGLGSADIRRAMAESKGVMPSYSYQNGERVYAENPLLKLITANRPTV